MLIGPAPDTTLPERGVLWYASKGPAIIHVMPLRPRFQRFLD